MFQKMGYLSVCAISLILALLPESKSDWCYQLSLTKFQWTDQRPRFIVNMTYGAGGTIESITTINEEIRSPVTRLVIKQQNYREQAKTIYNITTKLCDFQNFFNQVPVFKPIKDNILKQSNYSLSCPLPTGVYVMNKIRISSRNPLMAMMYAPRRFYSIQGGIYEEKTDHTLSPLSTYYFVGTILRKACEN